MSTAESKLQLLRIIMETEDESFISKMIQFAAKVTSVPHVSNNDELPKHVVNGIINGREQIENGQVVQHDVVKNKYRDCFPNIKI